MQQQQRRGKAFLSLILISLFIFYNANGQPLDSTRAPGLEIRSFHSKLLGDDRKIRIQTPAGMNAYDAYPVLYVLDGDAQTAMVAGQVQYLSESYKIIPNLIVVGIGNTDRMRDLTPTHSSTGPDGKPDTSANAMGRTSGGGERFLQFIRDELMPYIESRYKTAPYKILAGHSLGGLLAVHCLVNHPEYFNAYIALSPSLQWDNRALLKQAGEKWDGKKAAGKILFFCDANEDPAFHANQLVLDSLLKTKAQALTYKRNFYPEETHLSEPVKAFYDGIRFVYPNWHLPYNSSAFRKTMNSKLIRDHFAQLLKTYGYQVIPLHDEAIAIGRFLRNDTARISDAIDLLQWNAANYPQSPVAYETLADTYMKAGDTANARSGYGKAMQLDPGNAGLQKKLKAL